MGKLSQIKPNVPKALIDEYMWVIAGIPKSGKTTMFANMLEEHYHDMSKGVLFAFEQGYKAIPGIHAIDIEDWGDFEDQVDDLVENKNDYTYKLVGLDTVDIMYEMAQKKVIDEWNTKNPSKRTNDIGGVGAKGNSDQGYGVGYSKIKEKIRPVIAKLKSAGFGIVALTHSKDKTVEQHDGQKFDQLMMSLPSTAREIFVNDADFMLFITVEKQKNKNGVETIRKIYFRNDGYVEAGGRFTNVPEFIEYDGDVKKVLEVFENAVRGQFKENVDLTKIAKEQEKEREEKANKFVSELKKEKNEVSTLTAEELIEQINEITGNMDKDTKASLVAKYKEKFDGQANYKKFTDVKDLTLALKLAKEIVEE